MWIDAIVMAACLFGGHLMFPEAVTSSFVMKLAVAISILSVAIELTVLATSS